MHQRFSQEIKLLLQRLAHEPLSLGDILAGTAERGFSLVIALLVLPFLFPVPPGLTGIPGAGCFILAMQMALGRRSPWLPKKIAQFRFPRWLILQLLQNLKRVTRLLEKVTRPRLLWLAQSRRIWRVNGACIAWLSLLLISPIPLTNSLFALAILLLVVATLESDGLLMCISYVFTALISVLFGFLIYALWQAPNLLPSFFSLQVTKLGIAAPMYLITGNS